MLKSTFILVVLSFAAAELMEADEDGEDMFLDEAERESAYSHAFGEGFRSTLSTRVVTPNLCDGGSCSLDIKNDPFPCTLQNSKSSRVKFLRSPCNNAGQCLLQFDSQAPGLLRVKLVRADLSATDKLSFVGAFGDQFQFTNAQKGKMVTLPSTFGEFKYVASSTRAAMKQDFRLMTVAVTNSCQRVIKAPAGSGGRLIFPGFDRRNYTAGSVCQWWIEAPPGKKIVLKFNSFTVGTNVTNCQDSDYIGVDKSGDKTYKTSPVKFCGTVIPTDVTSDANKINVLAYGARGGRGFCCTYDVIDG